VAHLDADDVALTGGAAIELHLAAAGRPARRAVVGDLDFLARCLKAIPPSVTRDFLVSHYHRARPGVPKAMIQLVDPTTRMRIDIFSDSAGVIPGAQRTTIEGTVLNVLDARSIFDHKVQMLRTVPAMRAESYARFSAGPQVRHLRAPRLRLTTIRPKRPFAPTRRRLYAEGLFAVERPRQPRPLRRALGERTEGSSIF